MRKEEENIGVEEKETDENFWDYLEWLCDLMCGDPEPDDDEEDM